MVNAEKSAGSPSFLVLAGLAVWIGGFRGSAGHADELPFPQPQLRQSSSGILRTTLQAHIGDSKLVDQNTGATSIVHTPTFEGTIPGPTLVVNPGDTLSINLVNDLPPNPPLNQQRAGAFPHDFNTINLHTHGLEVSPGGISDNMAPRAVLPVPRDTSPVVFDYVDQWLASILAGPLFNRSRHPSAQGSEESGTPGALPRLSGTLVSPDGNAAIFAGTGGSKPIVAHEGERVADYVVQSIQTERVTVRGPDGERVVHTSEGEPSTTSPAPILSAHANGADPLARMRHASRYDPGPQRVPTAPIGRSSAYSESSDADTDSGR